jgi:lysophospholipase L1-like esterase
MLIGVLVAAVTASAAVGSKPAPGRYYLALGDSIAYGYQPTKPDTAPAASFHTGYVDVLAGRLKALAPHIRVVNYGCPGESTISFTTGCPAVHEGTKLHDAYRGSQLAAALAFLRAHPGEVSPVTVTLWGNDVLPLSQKGKRAPAVIASFASRFGSILGRLRAAAPHAVIVVSGAWNPEVDKLEQTDPLYRSLDAAIARQAARSGARVAKLFDALDGTGTADARKAQLCRLTFFCSKGDPHPTDAGYRAMAAAFLKASGY